MTADLVLMHYQDRPVLFDHNAIYPQSDPFGYAKPFGFWVSVLGEDDWPSWCTAEDFRLHELRFAHRVTLVPGHNVLHLRTANELSEFSKKFTFEDAFCKSMKEKYLAQDMLRFGHSLYGPSQWPIDWEAVSKIWDGLIISPYQWSVRMAMNWYYGWDCASGCIWNTDAIQSVSLNVFPALEAAE